MRAVSNSSQLWRAVLTTLSQPCVPRDAEEIQTRALLTSFAAGTLPGCQSVRTHSERTARFSLQIGEEIGLSLGMLEDLTVAALLHDCGKIPLDAAILGKPHALSIHERAYIETHSLLGADILNTVPALREAVPAALHHHERWDGNGYPLGIRGEAIPLEARIIAIADSFDAMTSARPYRVPVEPARALEIVESESGTQFDPFLAEAFIARHESGSYCDYRVLRAA